MGDRSVNVFSRVDVFLKYLSGKGKYIPFIPGWKFSKDKINTKYSIFFFPSKRSNLIYSSDLQSIKVYGNIKYLSDGQTLAYLIY